ncbi:MAG: hypothetical protein ACJ8GN_27390 [Longimicrobiaceae bacterium]
MVAVAAGSSGPDVPAIVAGFGDTGEGPAEVDVNYFTIDLGVHIRL